MTQETSPRPLGESPPPWVPFSGQKTITLENSGSVPVLIFGHELPPGEVLVIPDWQEKTLAYSLAERARLRRKAQRFNALLALVIVGAIAAVAAFLWLT